jgi:hypothetical protein
MKILVGIKRVVDYAVKVRVAKGTVELANVKQSMNPFCEVRTGGRSTSSSTSSRVSVVHACESCASII